MRISINLDNLEDINIPQYCFMWLLYNQYNEDLYTISGISDSQLEDLIDKQYISLNNQLTEKFIKNYISNTLQQAFKPETNVDKFIDQYRAIFPEGSNSSGYSYKGDKQGCIRKMRKFRKMYPQYTDDIILSATREYVTNQFFKGYAYMQTAAYFIEKGGDSNLAGLCENYINKKKVPKNNGFEEDLN